MTHKRIILSAHALARMRERGIARRDIRWLLARGTREPAVTFGGAQRWLVRGTIEARPLGVIFVESVTVIHVVTVLELHR